MHCNQEKQTIAQTIALPIYLYLLLPESSQELLNRTLQDAEKENVDVVNYKQIIGLRKCFSACSF
jgi:hypothetical protein